MNLLFRFLWLILTMRFRPRIDLFDPCTTKYIVFPTDLDVLRHVNNGKYFSMMDLARVDLMGRSGVLKKINDLGYYPVIAAGTLRFRRALTLFQKFEIRTQVIGWDSKFFYLEQTFFRQNEYIASGMVKARFMKKAGGSVDPGDLFKEMGLQVPTKPLPKHAEKWSQSLEEQMDYLTFEG